MALKNFLDYDGLLYWKQKLQTWMSSKFALKTDIPTTLPASGGNADTVNGHTVNKDVPADAKFTDTIYTHPATHPATMITEDATHRFITDAEKALYGTVTNKVNSIAGKGLSTNDYTTVEKTKLAGLKDVIVDNALSTTSENPVQNKVINAVLNDKVSVTRKINNKPLTNDIVLGAGDVGAIPVSQKGSANGLAELDADGKVLATQLPSYVDDVLEYVTKANFPATGETGKIYVETTYNKTYRWSGTTYIEISASLALGETSGTAYRGDHGKTAYDHSQSPHAPTNAEHNVLIGVQKNGVDVSPDSTRKVNITVPTRVGELINDSLYIKDSDMVPLTNAQIDEIMATP